MSFVAGDFWANVWHHQTHVGLVNEERIDVACGLSVYDVLLMIDSLYDCCCVVFELVVSLRIIYACVLVLLFIRRKYKKYLVG